MNGSFACRATLDTSKVILKHGSNTQQSTFMHIATNSIQCCWQTSAIDNVRRVRPIQCGPCGVSFTLDHLRTCPHDGAVFRAKLRTELLSLISSYAQTQNWHNSNNHLIHLTDILIQLFPPPYHDTSLNLHVTRRMCGVFTAQQSNATAKSLGFATAEEGQRLMQQVRFCCMDGIQHFFHNRKLIHATP